MNAAPLDLFVSTALSPEVRLPESEPLTLTRNFGWVVAFCVVSLFAAPVAIGWTASLMLN